MKAKFNYLFLLAILLPLALFAFPLWKITLEAPQYPGGISMYIWINQITGDSPSTLQNINILNHYVGMQFIVPDSIPELKYFPWVVGGMSLLGLLFFLVKKKSLYLTWAMIMIVLGGLGVYDFYLWEYDYGHNLDPKAPIKVPGMAYQPPVIGSKMLLNFKADSWPTTGGYFLGAGIALSLLAFWLEKKKTRKTAVLEKAIATVALVTVFGLSSCSVTPRPLALGSDHCHHCKMKIVQPQYGAELVSSTGKIYTFDAVECFVQYKDENNISADKIALEMVVPYDQPGTLMDATKCVFIRSAKLPSPMGMYITAMSSESKIEPIIDGYDGEIYTWEKLQSGIDNLPGLTAQLP
ncbi:MAG: nitrous oxide reductase accessory protein NosL [Imperialibacter sp.]|uniref:nitrous oxide reductase accessory protein NosL n=1 Tax=Imperialibacter sp. TaxID=2038411 RepID=UPI0032EE16C0